MGHWWGRRGGDFNGDGKSDILWQNSSTGQRSIWLMNGTVLASIVNLPTVPIQWDIVGVGDFNADGKSDILWQNRSTGHGRLDLALMNGDGSADSIVNLPTVPIQWDIAGVGDFNGDGKSDILWQNGSTGQRSVWLMNGTVRNSIANLPTVSGFSGDVGLAWEILTVTANQIFFGRTARPVSARSG